MRQGKGLAATPRLEKLATQLQSIGRTLERRTFLRWGLFLACAVALTLPGYFWQDAYARANFAGARIADWIAMDAWIKSAECMRRTGAWLTVCLPDGKLMPVAYMAGADDPGHGLLLSLAATVLNRPMTVVDIVRMNVVVDYVGLLAMATLLFTARCYIACLVTLLTGVEVYLFWVGISPHPALIGAAAMAAILPLAILLGEYGVLRSPARTISLGFGAAFLGLAALIREPIGTMGLLISLAALGWLIWRHPASRQPIRLLTLLALVLVAWQSPRWTILARDAVFDLPSTEHIQTHGTSHNLYMGLGAVENRWGITWDDSAGVAAARTVDPTVVYPSQKYYRLMWQIYFDRLKQDPAEVVRIYWTKAGLMLSHRLPAGWWALWVVLLLVIPLLAIATRRGLFAAADFAQGPVFLSVGLAFVGFFFLQGVLAQQGVGYAHPIGAFVGLFLAIVIEFAGRLLARRILPSSQPV